MLIRYETWHGQDGPFERFARTVQRESESSAVQAVCEIGGGANPILPLDLIAHTSIREYVVTDISEEELAKAPEGYKKVAIDVTEADRELGKFDLIISRTVVEHVTDPSKFHQAVFDMLVPGGKAMHFFPTLYEPAFMVNRLLPDIVANAILQRIQSDREHSGNHAKFPAYYRWCRGPTRRQLARFMSIGFEIEEYTGIFGHDYYRSLPLVDHLQTVAADILARYPVPLFTAYAWVILSRPPDARYTRHESLHSCEATAKADPMTASRS